MKRGFEKFLILHASDKIIQKSTKSVKRLLKILKNIFKNNVEYLTIYSKNRALRGITAYFE